MGFRASYIALYEKGELDRRAEALERLEADCRVCPRECRVRRHRGERGVCGASSRASVISAGPHQGEEKIISGTRGSGTIFFGHCNLTCVFCQNHDVSQDHGYAEAFEQDASELAMIMLALQRNEVHNINLVSPSHCIASIVRALAIAARAGLTLPLVYNSNGYDSLDVLKLLDGIVDIYMPDLKYADDATAERLSGATGYVQAARTAIAEMYRQVGDIQMGPDGVAKRGLLIRHLVLPGGLAGTRETVDWIAATLGAGPSVNIMSQYRPAYHAADFPELRAGVPHPDYLEAVEYARGKLTNLIS